MKRKSNIAERRKNENKKKQNARAKEGVILILYAAVIAACVFAVSGSAVIKAVGTLVACFASLGMYAVASRETKTVRETLIAMDYPIVYTIIAAVWLVLTVVLQPK